MVEFLRSAVYKARLRLFQAGSYKEVSPLMTSPLIEFKQVYKSYGSATVLNNISLSVHHGEFLTLLGPSGCGKTTLLRLISGFEQPNSGEIYINGRCVNLLPPQKRDVHTVFQSYALFPCLLYTSDAADE